MKINKVKIAGFKSFADPVEIEVLDGMTGIVGPNGCGKSNLIESLRWAMGETSAKRLRGGAMDDVIFGGTEIRPPKNFAEVSIFIDNPGRLGPPDFKDLAEMIVSRRIDRGDGSTYKVNGKAVRAKDVQVLYKDAGMGAGSSALVSQGMVASIINAKPIERRNLLEEAAGVAGLASRRHEAELRLRGTEENLEKAEMIEKGLNDQMSSLRRQARAAKRRREIDGMIRSAEAMMFLVRKQEIEAKLNGSTAEQADNEAKVKEAMLSLASHERSLQDLEQRASPLLEKKIAAETAFALAKATVENIKKEIQSVRNALANAAKSVTRADADIERENSELEALKEEVDLLRDEISGAEDDAEYDVVLLEENTALFEEAKEVYEAALKAATDASDAHSMLVAGRDALVKRVADIQDRLVRVNGRLENATQRKIDLEAELAALPSVPPELTELEQKVEIARVDARKAEEEYVAANLVSQEVRAQESSLVGLSKALKNELDAIERTEVGDGVAYDCDADEGFDEALAAALGSAYHAPVGQGDIHWWRDESLNPPALQHPETTTSLLLHVRVPEALLQAISAVGVVESDEDGEWLSNGLVPGQSLVSRSGRLWRWDGYRTNGDNAEAEATRRRRRLGEINKSLEDIAGQIVALDLHAVAERLAKAVQDEARCKEILKDTELQINQIKKTLEESDLKRNELTGKLAGLVETLDDAKSQVQDENQKLEAAQTELNSYASVSASEQILKQARESQASTNAQFEAARMALDKVKRDAEARSIRVNTVRKQISDMERRSEVHARTVGELKLRRAEAQEEAKELENSPLLSPDAEMDAIADVEEKLEDLLAAQELTKTLEEELLQSRELARKGADEVSSLKESRARLLAELKAAQESFAALCRDIEDRVGCKPDLLVEVAGISEGDDVPDIQTCESRVQRLIRERETLGTVNLLAEQQLEEVEGKVGEAGKMRNELREAVRQLRETITKINTECRERLIEAFTAIDANFRSLFKRVFNGGEAHLKLSGSDDPLEAGLEIFASPPGKKLQTMSLFSGGEQALMALSLIFAAFLIRPSPVCVLDEVDAPFDDANVDRMCNLVADLAADGTRFLVITHHALTMARCDRLYGVTMAERGVSKVMSVDVEEASHYVNNSNKDD